jgi:hypothetical protein
MYVIILEKGQVKSTSSRQTCMRNLMKVEEAQMCVRIVASRRKFSLATTRGNRRDFMYVCKYHNFNGYKSKMDVN